MKRLFIYLLALVGLTVSAQTYTGSWEVFPNYGTPAAVVETPEYVYTLSGTSLCGYDKATGEVIAYNTSHRLNGNQVSGIWYDPQLKYLFVVYADYNIDLVFDDGRTVNVPDLRDAAISNDKKVNMVAFSNGKAYVALNSGMLVVDPEYGAVIESCIWGKQVTHIAVSEKNIFIRYAGASPAGWYYAPKSVSHQNLSKSFVACTGGGNPANGLLSANGMIAMIDGNKQLNILLVNEDATDGATIFKGTKGFNATTLDKGSLQVTANGVSASGNGYVYTLTADEVLTKYTIAESKGNKAATWDGQKVWIANASGYGQYDPAQNAYAIAPVKPSSTSGTNVGAFRQTPDGSIYMSTVHLHHASVAYSLAYGKSSFLDCYKNGIITPASVNLEKSLHALEFVPGSSDEFIATYFSTGAARINLTNKTTYKYTTANTTITSNYLLRDVKLDSDGSLWFIQRMLDWPYTTYLIKVKAGCWETESDKAGWSMLPLPDVGQNHSSRMVIDEANRNILVSGTDGIAVVKMPAKNDPLSESVPVVYNNLTLDADGMTMAAYKYPTLVVDKNGWIWIGSDAGVRVVKNSEEAFKSGFAAMRPKVPRNDGTNLADYLLDQVEVFDIFVDENNQKWISTIGSGLYRVSADGSQILEHFTTENSSLPSNNVFAALADKNSNKVFVGTEFGLAIYHSTTVAAAPDYSDVYAYPNPVTPDYTGWITITGLMDNSLVKIADASGRVFFQGQSDGGMVTWNGCDASGRRVKSGVYFVFASQNEGGSSSAAVTKIVVVN